MGGARPRAMSMGACRDPPHARGERDRRGVRQARPGAASRTTAPVRDTQRAVEIQRVLRAVHDARHPIACGSGGCLQGLDPGCGRRAAGGGHRQGGGGAPPPDRSGSGQVRGIYRDRINTQRRHLRPAEGTSEVTDIQIEGVRHQATSPSAPTEGGAGIHPESPCARDRPTQQQSTRALRC